MIPKKHAAYTQGDIGKTMIKTGLAMVAGTLAMTGYNLADTYFVGKLGKSSLAAMGFSFPVIMLLGCLFRGLASGVMATTAQALGSGRKPKAATIVTSGLLLILIVSILLGVIGMLTSGWIFNKFGATGETLILVNGYMSIWYFGCATASLSMTGNDLLIATGYSKVASSMMIIGMIINVALDPILIFGLGPIPARGIQGAAIATIISQLIVTISVLTLLYYRHQLLFFAKFPWRKLQRSWGLIIRFAVPASLSMLMVPLGVSVLTRITATFGDTAVAATAAASRLEMAAFVFPMAIGIPLLSMISQNYGARLYSRIQACRRFSARFVFIFLLGTAIFYFFASPVLVRYFSSDPEVQKIMVLFLRIVPWGFGMNEIHRFSGFFYTGCGRPAAAAWLNAMRMLGVLIPISLLALCFHSVVVLFYARLIADLLCGTIGYLLARRMTIQLPEDGVPPAPRVSVSPKLS